MTNAASAATLMPRDRNLTGSKLVIRESSRVRARGAGSLDFLAGHAAVRLEDTGRGKLAEFVTDHVLGDVDGDERFAVMHAERVADEVGRDR